MSSSWCRAAACATRIEAIKSIKIKKINPLSMNSQAQLLFELFQPLPRRFDLFSFEVLLHVLFDEVLLLSLALGEPFLVLAQVFAEFFGFLQQSVDLFLVLVVNVAHVDLLITSLLVKVFLGLLCLLVILQKFRRPHHVASIPSIFDIVNIKFYFLQVVVVEYSKFLGLLLFWKRD